MTTGKVKSRAAAAVDEEGAMLADQRRGKLCQESDEQPEADQQRHDPPATAGMCSVGQSRQVASS